MITTAARLNSVHEYYFSQKLREIDALNKQGKNIINLGIGSPDMPPHPDVIKTLQEESTKPNVHGYQSYKGSPVLRNAFANWYQQWYKTNLDADTEILPLIGSKEGIMHICMTYLNDGDKVLVPNPGYPTYRSAIQLAGGICIDYELKEANNYYPDFDALEKNDLSKVKLMWVNYPQMPTGQPASIKLFEQLIAFGKKHNILICHDNPYSFILNDEPLSILSVEGAKDVALELNSLSKAQNMAGWRVGVLCGNKERISEVLRFKSNMDSGMFLPVQLAAAKALSLGKDWYESINAVYGKRREKVYELLDALHCDYSKNQSGMFMWAKIPAGFENGYALSDKVLYESNVFITPGGIFGNSGDNYIRISLCATEDKISEAIERVGN
ncbi:pyridoxal phosphate-dependent aminotransferase [Parafilimonas terrae]|uniref:Aminotransferase n=1 Tax=Parafilimonas terrae TaxID=1465490 RepID=A0A1I5YX71_9BACT|nr:aminotransferase class I/II-fold pyridoxal phosphate-dependent enzyme [Parafilimonas terrae]SFQ48836.1 Aspartate/methionine/tyrosine aminotransferase [Parafilimonas terrae]